MTLETVAIETYALRTTSGMLDTRPIDSKTVKLYQKNISFPE
jgi:hypothetical protein